MPSKCTEFNCLQQYGCNPLSRVQPGAVFAPYVSIEITGKGDVSSALNGSQLVSNLQGDQLSGNELTVGNQSCPTTGNHAVIKSFQYGASNGQGCVVEIFDEQGSEFAMFMKNLNNSIVRAPADYRMAVDFGWIIRKCDNTLARDWVSDHPDPSSGGGGRLYFEPMKVETEYSNGKIRFQLHATDLMGRISENRTDVTIGSDSQRVRLQPAIREMYQRSVPSIRDVQFLRQGPNGPVPYQFRNSDGGPEGPAATWNASQQNAMAAARQWLNNVTTDRGKGIVPQWNAGSPTPQIIFWEDGTPGCNENLPNCGQYVVGSYIVNGGDCSPVISFSPKIEWNFALNAGSGGNLSGATGGRQVRDRQPVCRQPRDRAGIQTQPTVAPQIVQWRPPDLAMQRAQQALAAHQLTGMNYEQRSPIECELKIQGDPKYVFPRLWRDKYVSIIVINPFHIVGGQGVCDWMAQPPCNSIFSSKWWRLMDISHEIKEGSYTTTLKVKLATPNVEQNMQNPFEAAHD